MGTPQFHAESARWLLCWFDRWQNRSWSPARLPGRRSCRSRLLFDELLSEPHPQLSRQPRSERDDHDDWEFRDFMLAVLSLEHWWGTRKPVRNVDSDRETSSLHEIRRVVGMYRMQTHLSLRIHLQRQLSIG